MDQEITLFNQLIPGRYHQRKWEVLERGDGQGKWREVRLPVSTVDARLEIPNSLLAVLQEMVDEAKTSAKTQ